MNKFFAILAAAALFIGAVSAPEAHAEKKLRVATVLTGPINDGGWNESAYKGLTKAAKELGVETAYSENVLQPDMETIMSDYASKGFDLVIGHGFEFYGPAKQIAADFPNTKFAIINGRGFQEPNLSTYAFRTEQSGFLAGAIAALITQSNKVGVIGGMNSPHIQVASENFIKGAKYINPNCDAQLAYVGSWTDVAKAKEMGISMLDRGMDVLVGNANAGVLGIIEAAKSRGKTVLGYIDDQNSIAPETIPVSVIQSVERLMFHIITLADTGKITATYNRLGINEGVVGISPFYGDSITPDQQAKIKEVMELLANDTIAKQGLFWELKK